MNFKAAALVSISPTRKAPDAIGGAIHRVACRRRVQRAINCHAALHDTDVHLQRPLVEYQLLRTGPSVAVPLDHPQVGTSRGCKGAAARFAERVVTSEGATPRVGISVGRLWAMRHHVPQSLSATGIASEPHLPPHWHSAASAPYQSQPTLISYRVTGQISMDAGGSRLSLEIERSFGSNSARGCSYC